MYAIDDLNSVLRGLEIYSTATNMDYLQIFCLILYQRLSFHKSKLQCTLILKWV